MIGIPRSTYYYRSQAHESELADERLIALVCDIRDQFADYGYRRVTHELRGAAI